MTFWLGTGTEPDSTLADEILDVLTDLNGIGEETLEHYASHLRRAFDAHPPPCGTVEYAEKMKRLAASKRWVASTLLANAAAIGVEATKLWELAGSTHNAAIAEHIRQHAIDLSRHSRMYVYLLRTLFPLAITDRSRAEVNALSPGYGPTDHPSPAMPKASPRIFDELVQMNLGAIRTRQNQILLAPILRAICPRAHRAGVNVVVDRLRLDATRHIMYTAELIDAASRTGRAMILGDLMALRTRDLNARTLDEIGERPRAHSDVSELAPPATPAASRMAS